ncbi:DNA-binding Lrp family transcriptional regulator [Kibdelosporangium banguiense]|uniref:DNA-binding Lrp family transcriptional regulator n=1 Tax=Kibdelosporangium banguiense TaxID=1365924 RepID=A0ABS4TJK4_9PSEU|nr:AsnC family protein [Kibdelosporangium banguiense]MBP2324041.1 DNA-binding Lrp family transcriptional regulator [Kibdelosporangium banguiense]
MVAPDPVDVRLLSLVAETGRAAVHEVAARMGMDPREVASRLVALSANGLPLVVGVECDPNGIRAALAAVAPPGGYPSTAYPVQGTPSGAYPMSTPYPNATPSGPYPQGTPSGVYSTGTPSGAYSVSTPSGPYPTSGGHPAVTPSGPYPAPAPYPVNVHAGLQAGYAPPQYQPPQPFPPSQPVPAQPPAPPDPVMSTWGPPQSSSWARGDQPAAAAAAVQVQQQTRPVRTVQARTGKVGGTLEAEGLDGELLAIQLVELVDPADFLFTAAGYRLQDGERSVVVHTEMVNKGAQPFNSLPDLYLVLITKDGQTVSKAPVSLSSRPPHRIGVAPGETAGGHTVYVLPENFEVTAIRWSPRPDDNSRALTWTVEL